MVELRKRAAPPPAPPPAKKKATAKPIAKKEEPAPAKSKAMASGGQPKVGDSIDIESFGGEVETNDGHKTTLSKLLGDSKEGVVLFTYPKASTPGCTTQVCLFRDAYEPLTAAGLSIYGLSSDSPKANTTFKEKQNLPYPLLCDPSQTLIKAIGMKKEPSGTTRGVFVVDKKGKVLAAEPGGPAATLDVVQALVKDMGKAAGGVLESDEQAKDKRVADVAAEVADTAKDLDKSGRGTPVNA